MRKEVSKTELASLLCKTPILSALNYGEILAGLTTCCKKGNEMYSPEGELVETWTKYAGFPIYIADTAKTYKEYIVSNYSGRKFYIEEGKQ